MKTLKIGDLLARLPIIQGGMGVGISLSGLASAVANQGGVGVISSAGLGVIYREHSKDYNTASIWGLREELRKAREKTKGIIGVNVMVAMSNFADMVRTAIAEKADIIFSGAGMPLNLPSFLTKGSKTKLAPIVSSARAAKLICEKWLANYKYVPDAIVVEGPKAGGHLGYKPDRSPTNTSRWSGCCPKSFRKFVVSARRTTRTSRSSQQAASTRAKTFIASWSWAPTVSRWARASSPRRSATPRRSSSGVTSKPLNRT